jgi:hypothetical protein
MWGPPRRRKVLRGKGLRQNKTTPHPLGGAGGG